MPPLPSAYNANSLASRLSQVRSILGITSQVSSARGVDGTGSDEKCTQTAVTQVGFDPVIPELDGLEIMQSSCFHETWKSVQFCRGVLKSH